MNQNEEVKDSKHYRPNPNVNLKCRFYEETYPSADDLVVVRQFYITFIEFKGGN